MCLCRRLHLPVIRLRPLPHLGRPGGNSDLDVSLDLHRLRVLVSEIGAHLGRSERWREK
jgi:hypothetical protein